MLLLSCVELRHRKVDQTESSELNDLLKAHHEAQEQVAEEMLYLTRALKDQTLAAGEIIKKDTLTLEKTNELADKNTSKLAVETERLQKHTNKLCRCWIWFLMLVVTITFIGMKHILNLLCNFSCSFIKNNFDLSAMVMVMKIFRKRFV